MRMVKGKKTYTNAVHVEGYLYEHNLESRVSGPNSKNPGTEFIMGTISIATDDEMLNVVPVHFSYVTPTYGATGKVNNTYVMLQSIIDGKIGSVMEHGKENAGKLRIDSAIGLNEWFDSRNNNELVSVKRNEGGFIHQTSELNPVSARSTFNVDLLINGFRRVEADEERGLPERGIVKGCIFDYRPSLLPVEFTVYIPGAFNYFESLDASDKNLVFTRVQGEEISKTIVRKIEEESAFGEPIVKESRSTQRDFVITWAQPEPYVWDDPSTLQASELTEMIANREIYKATLKKNHDEYQASKGSAFAATGSAAPKSMGVYNF